MRLRITGAALAVALAPASYPQAVAAEAPELAPSSIEHHESTRLVEWVITLQKSQAEALGLKNGQSLSPQDYRALRKTIDKALSGESWCQYGWELASSPVTGAVRLRFVGGTVKVRGSCFRHS
jgi:hypothetical protein